MSRILFWLLMMFLCSRPLWAAEVRVFAAASMKEVVTELCDQYAQQKDVRLVKNFAASGTLARQIAQGAPADLYISADPKWMDHLQQQGALVVDTRRTLAYNELAYVGDPVLPVSRMEDLKLVKRIAIGSPRSVPAGSYAEQAMRGAGLYEELLRAGTLVFAKDVRQALIYADRGEVEGAFVYSSDALLAQRARVLFSVPQELYPRVVYPLGLTPDGAKNPQAVAFQDYLMAPEAAAILKKYGFSTD